ncbi:MAG TPA: hypothetical protein VGD35_03130 [Chitinophaga sp.]
MNYQRLNCTLIYAAVIAFLSACGTGGGEKTSTDTTLTDTATVSTTPVTSTIVTTPQNMMVATHKVANFAKWHVAYDEHDSMRLANQIHSYVIGRGVKDSNMVLVAVKVDDMAKAKAFSKDPDLKKAMQKGGVTGTPSFRFITMTYQDTATLDTDLRVSSTFTVKDWDAWQKTFEEHRKEGLDNGLKVRAYGYDVDDNHKVMLVSAIIDTAKANAFWKSDLLKQRRAEAGVTSEPARFIFRVVRRY